MPYAKNPSPVRQHQVVNGNLYSAFKASIGTAGEPCSVLMPLHWKVNEKTIVPPDLIVVCKAFTTDFLEFTPSLVVDILAPSSALKDGHEKYELYEQEGVRYYRIVDPKFKKIQIYELVDGKFEPVSITTPQFTFSLDQGCQISVDFKAIWD